MGDENWGVDEFVLWEFKLFRATKWGHDGSRKQQVVRAEEIWLLVERALLARVGISWTRQKHEPLESNFLVNIAFFWVSILNLWGVAFCLSSVQDFDTQYPLVGTFPIFLYLDLFSSCPKSLVSPWKIAIIQESGQNLRVLYFKKPRFIANRDRLQLKMLRRLVLARYSCHREGLKVIFSVGLICQIWNGKIELVAPENHNRRVKSTQTAVQVLYNTHTHAL